MAKALVAGLAFALVLWLSGPGTALPILSLDGTIRSDDPLEMSGATIALMGSPRFTALAKAHPLPPADGQVLMEAETVELHLTRFVERPGLGPKVPEVLSDVPELEDWTRIATDASLSLRSIVSPPQVLFQGSGREDVPSRLNASLSTCLLHPAVNAGAIEFPEDPTQVSRPMPYTPGQNQLAAECSSESVEAARPILARLYGMELVLSSADGSEIIQTGTFVRQDAKHPIPQKVTQILEVRLGDPALRLSFPFPSRVSFQAERFAAEGRLRAGPSHGHLQWGAASWVGEIDPISASGAFEFTGKPEQYVGLSATTLEGPVRQAEPGTRVSPTGVASALTLAALATAVALAWLLGPLFSRLSPERLLEHPRRLRICEFVRDQPGVGLDTIRRSLGMPWVRAAYHVARLEQGGKLVVRRFGGRTACFVANTGTCGRQEQIALLRRAVPRRILELLHVNPGLDQQALGRLVGLKRSQVSQSLRGLESADLIDGRRVGRRLHYFPAN